MPTAKIAVPQERMFHVKIDIDGIPFEDEEVLLSTEFRDVYFDGYTVQMADAGYGDNIVGIKMLGGAIQYATSTKMGNFFKCTRCGAIYKSSYGEDYDRYHLELHRCFHCYHWDGVVGSYANYPFWFRINGSSYAASPQGVCINREPRPESKLRGHYGRTFRIRMLSTNEIVVVDDLWHQGEIPGYFREKYPNNAEFVYKD